MSDAEHLLERQINRQAANAKKIEELAGEYFDEIIQRGKNRWGTWGICSTMKYCEDRLMDAVNSNPLANSMNDQSEGMIKQIMAE